MIAQEVAHKSDRRTARRSNRGEADIPVSELLATHMAADGTVTYSGRAYAAVKLAMGSETYTDQDRADTAAELVAQLLADAAPRRRRAPMDRVQVKRARDSAAVRDLLGWLDTAESNAPREDGASVPAHRASVTHLYNRACHARRTIDRDRIRDAEHAAEQAAADFTPAPIIDGTDDPETAGTPMGARRAALDILASVGCRPLRKRDAAIYSLAYSAARAAAGLDSAEIAAELHLSPAAQRKHVSRAAQALRYGTPLQWADALAMPEGGVTHPRVAPMPESNGIRSAMGKHGHTARFPNATDRPCRDILATGRKVTHRAAAIQTAPLRETVGKPTRKRWTEVPVSHRRAAPWADGLPSRSQSRLAAAATVSRKRTDASPDELRISRRVAVGLPARINR